MRPQPTKYAVALLGCVSFFSTTTSAAQWNGSYSASGQCFCVGAVDKSLSSTIVPTPIGGQTVAQVCKRVGAGPGLYKNDGLFNYPAYSGAQCGNGPFSAGLDAVASNCAGTLDGKSSASSESCQPVGPQWDLKSAFSNEPVVASSKPGVSSAELASADQKSGKAAQVKGASKNATPGLMNRPVVTTHVMDAGASGVEAGRPLKATVISSASTAGRKLPKPVSQPPFAGKKVMIDGQSYMQARDGLDPSGGEPGSRIILDGLVFLRDDGSIVPADLYRKQPKIKQAAKRDKAVKKATVGAKKAAPKATAQDAKKSASLDLKAPKQNADLEKQRSDALELKRASDAAELKLAKLRIERQAAARASRQAAEEQSRIAALPALSVDDADDLDDKGPSISLNDQNSQIAIPPSPLSTPASEATTIADSEAAEQVVVATSDSSASDSSSTFSSVLSALRLPPEVRASSRNFSYLEAVPANYDVGGNGIVLEGSAESRSGFQYFGRVGVTGNYQELMVGAGLYLTPASADRFTAVLMAGLEHGSFALTDDQDPSIAVDFTDTGLYFGAATRFVVNNRFELKAGLGYSTFFEGDAMVFGGGYYHITRSLDLVSRFELGDNDLLGLGVRFYY